MDRFSGLLQMMTTLLLLLLVSFSDSATFISESAENVLNSHGSSTGRSLLQRKDSCPVSFEFMNYTGLTSSCKGPSYNTTACCAAFKEFACPYANELDDPTNNCATTMFSYINLYGKYPPGLFSYICTPDNSGGLECPPRSYNTTTTTTDSPPGSYNTTTTDSGNNIPYGGCWCIGHSYTVVLVVVSAVVAFVLT